MTTTPDLIEELVALRDYLRCHPNLPVPRGALDKAITSLESRQAAGVGASTPKGVCIECNETITHSSKYCPRADCPCAEEAQ